jgi:hypothetical protein
VFAVIRRLVVIAVPVLALGAAVSSAGPLTSLGIRDTAPPEPPACKPNPNSPASVGPSAWDDESLCGGRGNDKITSTRANLIWAYQGNDFIDAAQSPTFANEINGGPGNDRAYVDRYDLSALTGVESCKLNGKGRWRPCASLVRKFGRRQPETKRDYTYPIYQNYLQCRVSTWTGDREILFFDEPLMRAVDATPNPDWQTVAFKATLYKWTGAGPAADTRDGSGWTRVKDEPWLWDRTVDEATQPSAFPTFLGNFWRDFGARLRTTAWFIVPGPGQYRVGLTHHWYATPTVPAREFFVWAGPHYGEEPYEVPGHKWCNFPK